MTLLALEPRLLLDAAAVATAVDAADDGGADDGSNAPAPTADGDDTKAAGDDLAARALDTSSSNGGGEIVFIDTGVDDWQTLADGVDPAAEVVLVGPDQDGMQAMADTLAGRSDVSAVHVIGHGDVGVFELGSARVDASTLSNYAGEIAVIRDALAEDADLLLYGCYVGAEGTGRAFVNELAAATGADVAASNDLTGTPALGGDWTLEETVGHINDFEIIDHFSATNFFNVLTVTQQTTFTFDGSDLSASANSIFYPSETVDSATGDNITATVENFELDAVTSDKALLADPSKADLAFSYTTSNWHLVSLTVERFGNQTGTFDIVGYDNDSPTSDVQTIDLATLSNNTVNTVPIGFTDIDEFRIENSTLTGSAYQNAAIDDVIIDAAVSGNTTPSISGFNNPVAFDEASGAAVLIDSDATVADPELDALNSNAGDYNGASLTIERTGGPSPDDTFGFDTSGANFNVSGTSLRIGTDVFATFAQSNGTLTLTFNSQDTIATSNLADEVLQSLTYDNTGDPVDTKLGLSLAFSDGSLQTSDSVTLNIDPDLAPISGPTTLGFASTGASNNDSLDGRVIDEILFENFDFDGSSGNTALTPGTVTDDRTTTQARFSSDALFEMATVEVDNYSGSNSDITFHAYINGTFTGETATISLGNNSGFQQLTATGFFADEVRVTSSNSSALFSIDALSLDQGTLPPTVDADGDSTDGEGATVAFDEASDQGSGPADGVLIAGSALIADSDGTVDSITVTLTNPQGDTGEQLFLASGDLVGAVTGAGSGNTLTLVRNGATETQLRDTLRAVRFQNNDDAPTTTSRSITIEATDNDSATGSDTVTVTVAAANDAPVLAPASPTFTTIDEDATSNAGDTVSSLLGASVSDVDAGAAEGIAVTSLTSGNGTWQFSTNGGSTWSDVGAVADNSALLLRANDLLRFVPNGENGTSASVTYRAWDRTSGTEGNKVDASTNGTTTAFSTATDTASITVTAVNDAPTLSGGTSDLGSTNENTTTGGTAVSAILMDTGYADVDSGADSGIAVTATSANGTWQYSTGGSTWTAFGTVSASSALLLDSASQVRYVPDSENGETATFTFKAWDQTSGTASTNGTPQTADASTSGGTTAFSSTDGTGSLTVTDVNDAPVLAPASPTFTTIDEDATSNAGDTVSSLLGASVSDVDAGAAEGIAVTGLSSGNGTWQFSTDNGSNWSDVGAVADNSALLLRATDLLRFVPNGENGTSASVTYRAWDRTSGTEGNKVDASTNGTTTAFSTATDTASITVTSVNDAPVLTPASPSFTTIDEDTGTPAGDTVASLLGMSVSDVDSGAVEGIAVTGLTGNTFSWRFSTNGGASWSGVGPVSDSSALLLRANDLLRFIPNFENGTSASVTYRAWDQTSGSQGDKGVDTTTNGTTTAFSTATDTASITVTAVNDAPTATGTISSTTLDDNAGAQTIFGDIVIGDVDSGENDLTVEIRLSNASAGTISGGGFTDVGGGVYRLTGQTPASATTALDSAAFTPANNTGTSGTFATDFTIAVNDQQAAEVTHSAGTVTITRINDAPTIGNVDTESDNITIGEGAQDVTLLNDALITDPDAANFDGGQLIIDQTMTGATDGEWQLDTTVAGSGFPAVNFAPGDTVSVIEGGSPVAIGTVASDGLSGNPLTINLTANATPDRIEALLGALEYNILAGSPIDSRPFELTLSDGDGATSATATFTLEAVPPGPEITSITSTTADGLYSVGDGVDVTVTLDTASDFTANGGTLQATLSNGATVTLATADVTNTTTFSGTYTIQEGDGDTTDLNVTGINLTGGATLIANGGVAPADLSVLPTGNNLADNEDIDVDANTPSVAAPDLTAATDTGVSDSDDLTNNATPTITGNTEAGATVTVRLSSGFGPLNVGSTTADGSGDWSFTFDAGDLNEGANTVDIVASDAAGNTSADSADLTITLDTTGPTAVADSGTATEGDPASTLGGLDVTGNDTDTTGTDPVTAVAGSAANIGTAVAGDNGGLFTVNADGTVSFDPNGAFDALAAGATATTTVAVTVRDAAGNTATANLTVTVTGINDAPSLSGTATLPAVAEDTADPAGASVSSLVGGLFADPDTGASLSGIAITGNAATAAEGSWQVQIGGTGWVDLPAVSEANALVLSSASQLRFVPAADYNGTPGDLSVRAVDDTYAGGFSTAPGGTLAAVTQDVTGAGSGGTTAFAATDTALTTSITAVNDAPAITAPATASVAEDGTLSVTGVSIADADAAGGNLTVTLGVSQGVLALGGTSGLTVTGYGTGSVTATGTLADLNTALAGLTYTPAADFNGADSLAITVDDQGNSGGPAESDSAAVAITVNAVNDAPSLTGPASLAAVAEDAGDPSGASVATLVGGLFTDVDAGASLDGIAITGNAATAAEGIWQVRIGGSDWIDLPTVSSGAALVLDTASELRFVPAADYNGTPGALSLRAVDDSYAGAFSTAAGGTLADVRQDVTGAGSGGTTPISAGDTALSTSVTPVNDAPAITAPATATVAEDGTLSVTGLSIADLDAAGGNLTVTLGVSNGVLALAGTTGLTVTGDGTASVTATGTLTDLNAALAGLTYTPAADFNGADSLAVTVDDQGNSGGPAESDSAAVAITVTAVNDAPTVANAPADQSTDADGSFTYQLPAGTFADVDAGDTLTYTAELTGGGALPAWLSFDASTRTFSGTPGESEVGTISLQVTATDPSAATATTTFDLTVTNTAPTVATDPADQAATPGEAFTYQLPAGTFADPDAGATLTLTAGLAGGGALPGWLSFDVATRTFSGTPSDGDAGTLNLAVTAEDGAGATATATFDLTVEAAESDDPVTPTVTTLDRGPVRVTVIDTGDETVLIANSGVVSGAALNAILGTFDRGNSPLAQAFRDAASRVSDDPSQTLQTALGDPTTRGVLSDLEAIGGETLVFQNGEWRPLDLQTILQLSQGMGGAGGDAGEGLGDLVQGPQPAGSTDGAAMHTAAAQTGDAEASDPEAAEADGETAAALAAARASAKAHWLDAAIAALAEAEPLEGTGALAALVPTDRPGETSGFGGQLRERASAFDRDAAALAASLAEAAA